MKILTIIQDALIVIALFVVAVMIFALFGWAYDALAAEAQTGIAACASKRLIGHKTATGAKYDPEQLAAASAHFPLGSQVKVTNLANGKSVVVTINDKMAHGRHKIIMDVTPAVCHELEFPKGGESKVSIEPQ